MKKVLVIGAGVEQVPAIQIAKAEGHYVITTDMSMKAPGIPLADKAYKVSTTDAAGNLEIAQKEKIDAVLTVCSETAVPTVAHVAHELKLPGWKKDIALKATNKLEMRKAMKAHDVKVSPNIVTNKAEEAKAFFLKHNAPMVLKPIDSSGQRGTNMIENIGELDKAFKLATQASPSGKVLIDKFVKGPEIHVTMQIINGSVHFLAISDRVTLNKENFGIAVRHTAPTPFTGEIIEKVKTMSRKAVKAIGIENGPATCEIIIEKEEPILMEAAIRVPGGYLREVALYMSGIDVVKTTLWNALGIEKTITEMQSAKKHKACSVKFLTSKNLTESTSEIDSIAGIEKAMQLPGMKFFNIHHKTPFSTPLLNGSVGRFGALAAVGNSLDEALATTKKAFDLIKINHHSLKEYTCYNPYNYRFK